MNDGTRKLRIRTSPPLNSNGKQKVWNGYTWKKASNVLASAKAKAIEDLGLLRELEANLATLTQEIERLKGINPNNLGLPILIAELEKYEKSLIEAESTATNSIKEFYYLRNGTPRGGKSKKRR